MRKISRTWLVQPLLTRAGHLLTYDVTLLVFCLSSLGIIARFSLLAYSTWPHLSFEARFSVLIHRHGSAGTILSAKDDTRDGRNK